MWLKYTKLLVWSKVYFLIEKRAVCCGPIFKYSSCRKQGMRVHSCALFVTLEGLLARFWRFFFVGVRCVAGSTIAALMAKASAKRWLDVPKPT